MHNIYFYKDKKGKEPVLDYLRELIHKNDKESRIKANKIQKTPKREIEQAKKELADIIEREINYD